MSRCQLEEEEEELYRLMVEISELRAKLVEAEDEIQEGKRWLEATQRHAWFRPSIAAFRSSGDAIVTETQTSDKKVSKPRHEF